MSRGVQLAVALDLGVDCKETICKLLLDSGYLSVFQDDTIVLSIFDDDDDVAEAVCWLVK